MSIVAQLFVVFFVYLASEGIAALLPFTFPASVMGMVSLLVLLLTKVLKPAQLKESSDFLLGNMLLFFIPTCVSVITYADVLFRNFWVIVGISILTTPLVFFVTGHVVQLTMKRICRRGEKTHV